MVDTANASGLTVVIDLHEDQRAGMPEVRPFRLPTALAVPFWRAVADRFRANPNVIFDVYNEPSVGRYSAQRTGISPADWDLWRNGGSLLGKSVVGMQTLVDAIRAEGAQQVVVVEGLRGGQSLTGIEGHLLRGTNIMYSVHPYFANYSTPAAWDANFGFLTRQAPVFAGEWGLIPNGYNAHNCRHVTPAQAPGLIRQLLHYFQDHRISWTAYAFQVPKMIQSWQSYAPTTLDQPWTCGDQSNLTVGMGAEVKAYLDQHPAPGAR